MTSFNPRDPYDVQVTRLAVVTADLLAREMDDIFLDLIHNAGTDRHAPHHGMAHAANRIVVRCLRLVADIRCYERYNHMRQQQEEKLRRQQEEHDEELDIPL